MVRARATAVASLLLLLLLLAAAPPPAAAGPIIVTGPGAGGGPEVRVFDAATGALIMSFFAFDPGFLGGVRVGSVDANGDGIPDVVVAAGPGGGPHLRVFDGAALVAGSLIELVGFLAYDPALSAGLFLAGGTPSSGLGAITAVTAGPGLAGGGTSGAVALSVDTGAIQARVTGTCPPGQYVQAIGPTGLVTCGTDADSGGDISAVTAGPGLTGGGTTGAVTLAVDTAAIQARVAGTCPSGQYVQAVGATGLVTCGTDANSGGTVTSVAAGPGLTGAPNPVTGAGTLAVDFAGTGAASTAARSDHHHDTSYWALAGNAGTTPGTHFLGTTDPVALELRVNGLRSLRLEPGGNTGFGVSPNVIGGFGGNVVTGSGGGTIAGGGGPGNCGISCRNEVTDEFGTIGGGAGNLAGFLATVGGGFRNSAGSGGTVGGGTDNTAAAGATVGGGDSNRANGILATVPGGSAASASRYGQMAYASGSFDAIPGTAQGSLHVLRGETLPTNPAGELFLDGTTGSARISLADGQSLTFDILVTARSSVGDSAGFRLAGVIKRIGATTSLVGAPTSTPLGTDHVLLSAQVGADDGSDALTITVNQGTLLEVPVRWVAVVRTTEVRY
jgi:hypothetical protein